jgi:transglutaminase-like putative cysteine protease
MLETGNLGGKCVDINSLFVGLARAQGVPAREMFGMRVADSGISMSLGRSGDVSKAQHCRAEFYVAGYGWVPVDPADVRKVMLEEQLPLESAFITELRELLFGTWEMNWVGFNHARDFRPSPEAKEPMNFFMYPEAETVAGPLDGTDPEYFRYKITARPV